MKRIRFFICLLLLMLNLLVVAGFFFSLYSPCISPVRHPVWACAGLLFPVFALANLAFLLLWLCVRRWFALLPLLAFAFGWDSLTTYCPAGTQESPRGEALKLLTYNTQGVLSPGTGNADSRRILLDYLKESGADIICLQEFVPGTRASRKKIERELSSYPYHDYVSFQGRNGVACFSRYPILSSRRIDYRGKYNGSVLYRLQKGEDTLVVINNHLESNKLQTEDKQIYREMLHSFRGEDIGRGGKRLLKKLAEAVSLRAPQADSVAQAISRNKTRYMMVCGDFNDSPISYVHKTVGQGLTDAYAVSGLGPGFTYNQNRFYFRIDHIFTGDGFRVLQCKVDRSIRVSDHYPMWCLLETIR